MQIVLFYDSKRMTMNDFSFASSIIKLNAGVRRPTSGAF